MGSYETLIRFFIWRWDAHYTGHSSINISVLIYRLINSLLLLLTHKKRITKISSSHNVKWRHFDLQLLSDCSVKEEHGSNTLHNDIKCIFTSKIFKRKQKSSVSLFIRNIYDKFLRWVNKHNKTFTFVALRDLILFWESFNGLALNDLLIKICKISKLLLLKVFGYIYMFFICLKMSVFRQSDMSLVTRIR